MLVDESLMHGIKSYLSDIKSGKDWQGASWNGTSNHQGLKKVSCKLGILRRETYCELSSTGNLAITREGLSGKSADDDVGEVHVD